MPGSEPATLTAGRPLSPLEFHVLLALGDSAAHGYAIGKEIEQRSHGTLSPTTGALYQALRRLLAEGLLELASAPAEITDARRRYYEITERGRECAVSEATRLQELVDAARAKHLLPQRS